MIRLLTSRAVRRLLLVAGALGALSLGGCGPPGPRLKGRRPPAPMHVGGVSLPEVRPGRAPRPFAFRARPGHVLVAYFGFASCPDVCPTTLADLRAALERLGPEASRVGVAFVTVDMARDTAGVLVPYLASFVRRGHALRPGSQADLGRAERAFGATSSVTRGPGGEIQVSHTPLTYVVDARGDLVLQWDFGTSPEDMAHDLRALLAASRVGGP
jgi:cytochrome oxidase Cu insertion factor (SCO1/SenC/PrrC family)